MKKIILSLTVGSLLIALAYFFIQQQPSIEKKQALAAINTSQHVTDEELTLLRQSDQDYEVLLTDEQYRKARANTTPVSLHENETPEPQDNASVCKDRYEIATRVPIPDTSDFATLFVIANGCKNGLTIQVDMNQSQVYVKMEDRRKLYNGTVKVWMNEHGDGFEYYVNMNIYQIEMGTVARFFAPLSSGVAYRSLD
ncbi:MAG: hypothetical protein ACRC5C_03995 [Bacilli bacterium]